MQEFPKVFVIILNYNGKKFIKKTLMTVFNLDYPNFETILVDNASTDGSFEMLKGLFSNLLFIKNNVNKGFSGGNNEGIKYALERDADFVLLLNYDTEVEKSLLKNLILSVQKNEKIGLISPIIFSKDSSKVWFSGGKIDWLRMKTIHETEKRAFDYENSDYLTGCSLLVKKEVFKKIGLLDEDYFLYWEDVDFSVRAKRAGYGLVISSKSRIFHLEKSENEKNKENKIYWLVLSGLIFFQKNAHFWQKIWLTPYFFVRKIKNYFDLKKEKNTLAKIVKKAYDDFGKRKKGTLHNNC